MKLAHLSDLHITEGRHLEDVLAAIDWCIEDAIAEAIPSSLAWLVTGDIWGTTVPHYPTERERLAFAVRVQRMAGRGPMFVLYGNHDSPLVLELMCQLETEWLVTVAERPEIYGRLTSEDQVNVICCPYPLKRWLMASGGTGSLNEKLFDILRGMVLSNTAETLILAAHLNIGGSRTGGGEVLTGLEVELSRGQLQELFELSGGRLKYAALGHIHAPQQIGDLPAYYAGTPCPQNFGDVGQYGYNLVDVDPEGPSTRVSFREAPGPRFATIDVEWKLTETGWLWQETACKPIIHDVVEGIFGERWRVKLRLTVPEEQRTVANPERLIDELKLTGATVEVPPPRILPRARQREAARVVPPPASASMAASLKAFWSLQVPPVAAAEQGGALEKLSTLLEGAAA